MKKVFFLWVVLFLYTDCYALAPEHIIEKKYFYEIRCTCGLLFKKQETTDPYMDGKISGTTCYDCFREANKSMDIFSFPILSQLYVETFLAKERQAEKCV